MPENFSVIILGAGACGLLLAQGLKMNNIKTTIYERESPSTYGTRPREWGMTLHYGKEYLAKCVPPALLSRLNEAMADPFYTSTDTSFPFFNGQTGEKFFDMPGFYPQRVSRRKLRNLLSTEVDGRYEKVAVDIVRSPGGATVNFADSTSATASLIVGCEGVRSATRIALVGQIAAQNTNVDIQMFNVCWRVPAPVAILQRKAHPAFKVGSHPDNLQWIQAVMDVTDPDRPETWLFQQVLSWSGAPRPEDFLDQASRTKFWRDVSVKFADPWKTTGENIPDDLEFGTDPVTMWKPDMDWTSSPLWPHVTLSGDAAHNFPPFRGQGLNQAFMDAAELTAQLANVQSGDKTLEEAIRAYETAMKERSSLEVDNSLKQSRLLHDWEKLMHAPMIKQGMHQYRQEMKVEGKKP